MKSKTDSTKLPSTDKKMMIEAMLAKRDTLVAGRDELVAEFNARLATMDAGIESLDSVLAMFDPRHVPLEIRNVQRGASMLTISARPLLTEQPESTTSAPAEKSAGKKRGPKPKDEAAASNPADDSLTAAVAEKATRIAKAKPSKPNAKSKQRGDAAREAASAYFAEIDKLKTLLDIVESSPEGLPFRRVKELFLKKHPLELKTQEMKKVFGDRLSNILYSMSQGDRAKVMRSERVGTDGKKEYHWVSTATAPRETDGSQVAEAQSAA